jgi:hypothetical protein
MTKWEYLVASVAWETTKDGGVFHKSEGRWALYIYDGKPSGVLEGLNQLGEEGWELVAANTAQIPVYTGGVAAGNVVVERRSTVHFLYFKRPLLETA